jgi:hypothetical protein
VPLAGFRGLDPSNMEAANDRIALGLCRFEHRALGGGWTVSGRLQRNLPGPASAPAAELVQRLNRAR